MSTEHSGGGDSAVDGVSAVTVDEQSCSSDESANNNTNDNNNSTNINNNSNNNNNNNNNNSNNNNNNSNTSTNSKDGIKDARLREDLAISTAKETGRVQRISSNLRGVVRWYNSRLCYGFIEREDTKCELFVHRNSVVMAPGEPVFLRAESEVIFDLWTLPDGRLEAQAVRASNGEAISLRGTRSVPGLSRSHHYGGLSRSHDFFPQPNAYGCYVPSYCPCCARPIFHGGGTPATGGVRSRRSPSVGPADAFNPAGSAGRRPSVVQYLNQQPLDQ